MSSTTTNPSFPTQVTQDGSGVSWTDPSVLVAAGVGAEAILYTANSNHFTKTLKGTGIIWCDTSNNPITIPNDAIILGITMTVNSETSGGSVHDSSAYGAYNLLGVPAVAKGDALPATPWLEGTVLNIVRGGPADTWGCPFITPAQLNDPSFGWSFSVTGTQLPGRGLDFTAFYVTLQVTYSEVVVPPPPTVLYSGYDFAAINNVWGAGSSAPSAPVVSASSGASSIGLSWAGVSGASYFNIYRGTTPGGESGTPLVTNVVATVYTDSAVVPGTTYYYYVTAVGFGGASSASNEVSSVVVVIPTIVQAGVSNFSNGSAVDIGIANNPTPGNLLVALAFCASVETGPVVGITGFTQQATYTNTNPPNSNTDGTVWVGTRVVQAGDGKNYTVNFTGSTGGGDLGGILFELSGWVNISAAAGVASVAGQIASTPNMSPIGSNTFSVLALPFGTTTATYTPSYFTVGASNRGSWMGYYTGTPTAVPVTETFTGSLVNPAVYALVQVTG